MRRVDGPHWSCDWIAFVLPGGPAGPFRGEGGLSDIRSRPGAVCDRAGGRPGLPGSLGVSVDSIAASVRRSSVSDQERTEHPGQAPERAPEQVPGPSQEQRVPEQGGGASALWDGSPHAPALSLLPSGLFIITSAHDDERAGARVTSVQVCATAPLLLCVASRKGHRIEPLIRDSHAFAVCLVAPTERRVLRKFPQDSPGEEGVDPFDSMLVETMVTGSPVMARSLAVFDCEVVRHFDMEADHELYVGQVMASRVSPAVQSPAEEPSEPASMGRSDTSLDRAAETERSNERRAEAPEQADGAA